MQEYINNTVKVRLTASVVWWSEFFGYRSEVPVLIPGPTRFSEK
jgi:hypothetical protein